MLQRAVSGGGSSGSITPQKKALTINVPVQVEIENGIFYVYLTGTQGTGGYGVIQNGALDTSASYTSFQYCTITYNSTTHKLSVTMTYNYGASMALYYVSDKDN